MNVNTLIQNQWVLGSGRGRCAPGRRAGSAARSPASPRARTDWVFITGGCSGRGVQWIGVVLYNKLVYNII